MKKKSNYEVSYTNNNNNINKQQQTNNNKQQQNITPSFNATEDQVKITTKTSALIEEMNTSGKWSSNNNTNHHQKIPEINHNDVESVLQNQNIDNSSLLGSNHNIKSSADKNEVHEVYKNF